MTRQNVDCVVFRKITYADWTGMYRQPRDGDVGGMQKYIDFPTKTVSPENWQEFFRRIVPTQRVNGPSYEFQIKSLGFSYHQTENRVYQRQINRFALTEQRDTNEERVRAWTNAETEFPIPSTFVPETGIPDEQEFKTLNPDCNLTVYIARLASGEYWASWFQEAQQRDGWFVNPELERMFNEDDGYLELEGVFFETKPFDGPQTNWPFRGN